MTISAAAAIHAGSGVSLVRRGADVSQHAAAARAILIVSLMINSVAFACLVRVGVERLRPGLSSLTPMILLLSMLLGVMIGSVTLAWLGLPMTAALLAGAPPTIFGGFYGAFFVFILIARPR